jgi:hypothetical protein
VKRETKVSQVKLGYKMFLSLAHKVSKARKVTVVILGCQVTVALLALLVLLALLAPKAIKETKVTKGILGIRANVENVDFKV